MTPPFERRAVLPLAGLYVFRMLGLFMVLPVLSLYGDAYSGASAALLGIALGAYGFSQAILQIPFGYLSDRFGRKPLITIGLLLFAAGSVVAAVADSVYGLIAGRFLQGCGAIASVLMAFVADLTAEENRTKAMALIGASIGVAFSLALIIGPLVTESFGLAGVFWLTAILAISGLWLLWYLVPAAPERVMPQRLDWGSVFRDLELWRLNIGIFALHFVLMATFIAMPRYLELYGLPREQHWLLYLPVMVLSFLAMLPFMILGEKRGKVKQNFIGAIALLAIVQVLLGWLQGSVLLGIMMLFGFFMAFNLLEATLPSWVSKVASTEVKGTATGVYSSWQFAGAFAGGASGGVVFQAFGFGAVFALCAVMLLVWLLVALFQQPPAPPVRLALQVPNGMDAIEVTRLSALPGVKQLTWVDTESTVLLQVDARHFDNSAISMYRWREAQ
ncbi:MFS transporter [Simiduia litorea]|uniref:MFS transporter n=1 Tax=Simiduia litorea TaxID=1435348 RepID=UPI0036F416EB